MIEKTVPPPLLERLEFPAPPLLERQDRCPGLELTADLAVAQDQIQRQAVEFILIGRLLVMKLIGIQPENGLQQGQTRAVRPEGRAVRHMQLKTGTGLPRPFARGRLEHQGAEATSGQRGRLQGGEDVPAVPVRSADQLEGRLAGDALAALGAFVFHFPVYLVYLLVMMDELTKFIVGTWRYTSRRWIHNLTATVESQL